MNIRGIDALVTPQFPWTSYTKRTKDSYIQQLQECFMAVTDTLFPNESEEVMQEVMKATEESVADIDKDVELLEALSESYKVAESWQVKRQILSIICKQLSFQKTCGLIPHLTEYRYYIAKKHNVIQGCALPPATDINMKRQRMDPTKLDSFLDFITSSHILKDLPFGERTMKLSDGRKIETPNVIRCMGSSAIIEQFKQYCRENDTTPLGRSHTIMFNIISFFYNYVLI